MLNINLFGGPGTGKSTTAAEVFALMKRTGYQVELLQEYAKDLTYANEQTRLSDQVHILGEQHHRMARLQGSVGCAIHDSPFVMGVTYASTDNGFPLDSFTDFAVELFKSYKNINIFLVRDTELHPYQEYGRSQTLAEAEAKDLEIYDFLTINDIPFTILKISDNTAESIVDIIKG